jgi:hypothetical protein
MDFLLHMVEMAHPEYVPYITCVIAIAAAIAIVLPPPDQGSNKGYVVLYRAVQSVALNFGHAKNATDPQVAGLAPDVVHTDTWSNKG